MRDPYETIATGPWRDGTHQSAVEATATDLTEKPTRRTTEEIMADVATRYPVIMEHLARSERGETPLSASQVDLTGQDRPTKPPAEFTGAQVAESGRATRVEAGFGAGRPISDIPVETGSGNVFRDLGFADPEAELAKADARIAAGDLGKARMLMPEEFEAMQTLSVDDAIALIEISGVEEAVAAIYDAAHRLVAQAGSLPLVSSEPWEESDEALKGRLLKYRIYTEEELAAEQSSQIISAAAEYHGVIRARLVQTQGGV